MLVHFVFIGEGSSDDGLIPHLQSLCLDAGASEVSGVAPDFRRLREAVGHSVEAKLRAALALEPQANLVFIHRDADARSALARHAEIEAAVLACECDLPVVRVVPVQETEAWLLLNEASIRRAVGRPSGRVRLALPRPDSVERLANPKERLKALLERASEAAGRRLDRIRQEFPTHRRMLLEELSTDGTITRLASWQRMRAEIQSVLSP